MADISGPFQSENGNNMACQGRRAAAKCEMKSFSNIISRASKYRVYYYNGGVVVVLTLNSPFEFVDIEY